MSLDFLDINDVHILDETGAQVDRVTGLPYKDENLSATEKAQARVGIAANVLQITSGSFSSLPQTITNAKITSKHVVVNSVLSNPSAQISDWTVNTANGSLTILGSISGATTITLYLYTTD